MSDGHSVPSVFISYSYDSEPHRTWVRRLATDLQDNGVDVWFDQFDNHPGHEITSFMEHGVTNADFVILVCTEQFAAKAKSGFGGGAYEVSLVTAAFLYSKPRPGRFFCVLRQGTPSLALPTYMQNRVWIDLRDDTTYTRGLEQILMHVLNRHKRTTAAVASSPVTQPSEVTPAVETQPPRCWVLVAGTGASRGFSQELEDQSKYLGELLASNRCGLVTGGWPGVDEWVARAFAEVAIGSHLPLEDALVQVVVEDGKLPFAAGEVMFVSGGEPEWNEPIRRADVVILLGGLGGTLKTGELALRSRKAVLPVPETGGDANRLYTSMLVNWEELGWMGIGKKEFQRLGRPGTAGLDAAVELALKLAAGAPR